MRNFIVSLALVAETALIVWTGYVLYRWWRVTSDLDPNNRFADLVPYYGDFDAIVAPWLAASAIIPACFVVIGVAEWLRHRKISS